MRLFSSQSDFADRLAAALDSQSHCTTQMQLLTDRITILEEEKKIHDEERGQLRAVIQDFERKGLPRVTDKQVPVAAVVVMACSRPDYLGRTIESILKYQLSVSSKFPLFISQDGANENVKKKALSYSQLTYLQHLDFGEVHTERPGELVAYYKIASHYKWALDELFYKRNFSRVIILEDDMEISVDFFDYFEAAAALLEKDKTIMAVSSWNDNGQKQFVHDPNILYRSDFFPGLGWMLTKSTWDELSPKWPKAYWDDWLRLHENHKGRQFVRPEVCRTYNFGEHGSSLGQFFKQYLEPIKMNDVQVDWKSMDLSYLLEDNYPRYLANIISNAKPVRGTDAVLKAYNIDGDVRIQYEDQRDFERVARQFGIFEEWKDGIPRTAYKGVVVFRFQTSRRIFLVGPESLKQLGIEHT